MDNWKIVNDDNALVSKTYVDLENSKQNIVINNIGSKQTDNHLFKFKPKPEFYQSWSSKPKLTNK